MAGLIILAGLVICAVLRYLWVTRRGLPPGYWIELHQGQWVGYYYGTEIAADTWVYNVRVKIFTHNRNRAEDA